MISEIRIFINNFQSHNALWLFEISVNLLETGVALNLKGLLEVSYPFRSRASHTVEDTPHPTLTKV